MLCAHQLGPLLSRGCAFILLSHLLLLLLLVFLAVPLRQIGAHSHIANLRPPVSSAQANAMRRAFDFSHMQQFKQVRADSLMDRSTC